MMNTSLQSIATKGDNYIVPNCSWESYSYEYDREARKMKKEQTGTFTQYPLRLAWAITVHKSQGMTFDKMYLDLSRGMFAPGQLYVASMRGSTSRRWSTWIAYWHCISVRRRST